MQAASVSQVDVTPASMFHKRYIAPVAWRLYPLAGLLVLCWYPQQVRCQIETTSARHNVTLQGESGPLCTHIGRHCLKNVSCVDNRCVCPPGYIGNGLIECVKEKNLLCVVAADPHLFSFSNGRADVDLPCTYRLTRFITDHRTSETPFAYCSVEVMGTNELSHGRYYVGSVRISVGIVDSGTNVKDVFEVHKYGTNEAEVFNYLSDVNHTRILWGSSVHEEIQGVDVFPTFDTDNNFAVLDVPQCAVRVKFRAYDPSRHRQRLLPGISIMAPGNSAFLQRFGVYPKALCGTNKDSEQLYEERAEELGLRNSKLAIIYDILTNASPQIGNSKAVECEAAFEAFKTATDKAEDLNYCGNILTVTRTRLCIVASQEKYQPITIFTTCLNFRHTGSNTYCRVLENAREQCGTDWKGPDFDCGP